MYTQQIRRNFLQYFKEQGHSIINSSPVLPHDDPTLLFTNAGMNQFKDVFLGKSTRDYTRAATSQKCIRVGGKHNDLDNVGHTRRHLTFFEMLGNFSFGDYFKADAIRFAWEVTTKIIGFDGDRIWPSVFRDDEESFSIWQQFVPTSRITRFGEKENFWAMGDTGPCGPCSELLYDRGPTYGAANNPSIDIEGERFLEFWNLVFMQFNRRPDGVLEPLPKPSIDTGAGLERVVGLVMDVGTLFETDVLRGLIAQVENISKIAYLADDTQRAPAFHVVADHLRCLAFAIADGVQPSNVDRGYVLRKVLRRAVRYGRMLGMDRPFLAKVLPRLVESMGPDYPELVQSQDRIAEILTNEEEAFLRTLRRGGNLLNQVIEHARKQDNTISGEDAFKLKDTYGLPLEEILLIAKDGSLRVDTERYMELENEARERSRSAQKVVSQIASESVFADFVKQQGVTEFVGYTQLTCSGNVTGIFVNGSLVDYLEKGQEAWIVLDQTPFYAEMGGQIGDTGILSNENVIFQVTNCVSPYKGVVAHVGVLKEGKIRIGDTLEASIDENRRAKIVNNHTATHLLHWALQVALGEHVRQTGSVVEPSRLRFDFSHHKPVSTEELHQIEDLVNNKIRQNLPVEWYEIPYEQAQKRKDIKQFFGEKYGHLVRVVDIDFSKELCGGTHVVTLGQIGYFRIIKESSIAAGMRRIEAVTGEEAEAFARNNETVLDTVMNSLKAQPQNLLEKVNRLLEENKQLANELKTVKKERMMSLVSSLVPQAEILKGVSFLSVQLPVTSEELRVCAEDLATRLPSAAFLLASTEKDKCHLIARVSEDLVSRGIKANELVRDIAPIIEGSGGGKPNNAQAGGKAPQNLPEAFKKAREYILAHAP